MELKSLVGSSIQRGDLVRLLLGFGIQAQHLRFLLDVHRNGSTLTQGREQGARVHAEGQEGMEVVDKLRQRGGLHHLLHEALGPLTRLPQHAGQDFLALVAQEIGWGTSNTW